MKVTIGRNITTYYASIVTVCPHCGSKGTFNVIDGIKDASTLKYNSTKDISYILGIRQCPNEKCKGHLFFISDYNNEVLFTSPSVSIPFDRTNIPDRVLNSFEEAIKCHAEGLFISSAIMIRRTLEEICSDKGAKGKNLYQRIENLKNTIVIPQELIGAMEALRLLGNDAAHIESKTFAEVGKSEIEVSITLTKEILKAVYQYSSLLEQIENLKKKKEEA